MRNIVVILVSIIALSSCTKEIIQYKLTTSSTPITGGTVIPTSSEYEKGSNVSITATPAGEYLFKEWQGSLTGTNNPTSILIDSDKQVTSVFEKRQYPLNLVVEGNGAIKEEVIAIATQSQYPSGSTVRLTPTAATNWQFKGWEGDIVSADAILEIKVLKAVSLKAVFVRKEYPLNLTIEGNGSVKEEIVAVATQSIYPAGTTVKLTAKPNIGSVFSDWSGDITSKDSIITVNVVNTLNIKARFKDLPMVPAVNTDSNPDFNWNDHAQGKNGPYDFNLDGIPDIVSYKTRTDNSTTPPIVEIIDYTGKQIYNFNLKNFKPAVRDSLLQVIIDFRDLNNDGYLDLGLSYMGEWWKGQNGAPGSTVKYIGNNIYLLLSKGSLQYDPIEVLDAPNKPLSFNINLFDWDFDGKEDVLLSDVATGDYLKNLGGNKFEMRKLGSKLFNQSMNNKVDFDRDGKLDFINLYVNQFDANNYSASNDNSQILSVLTNKGVSHFPVVGKVIKKYIYILGDIISAERIAMVDGDGDGDMDLVVGSLKTNTNARNTFIQDYFENTGSQFEYRPNYIEIDESLIGELQVWATDIDKDGDTDLFYPTYRKNDLNSNRGSYFWWENTKTGFKINKSFYLKY